MFRQLLLTVVILSLMPIVIQPATPSLINYQGNLTDGLGSPVADGSYSITFTIYDGPGNPMWAELQNVHTSSGSFAVFLGSVTHMSDTLFNDTLRYLGIKVGSDPEMTPRTRLVTVPYTFRTSTLDGATGGAITGELDLSNFGITADTVFGYRSQVDNDGTGTAVGGFFSASAKNGNFTLRSVGVMGESIGDGKNIVPTGVFGRGVNVGTGRSYGGRFVGKTGVYLDASQKGIDNNVSSNTETVYGIYNNIRGDDVYPTYGFHNLVLATGGDVYGSFTTTTAGNSGTEYGAYYKTSYDYWGGKKYGTYVEGYGSDGFEINGHYTDIQRNNSGTTYGANHLVRFVDGGTGTGYGSRNYVRREAEAGTGVLYGSSNLAWNFNTANSHYITAVSAWGYSSSTADHVYGVSAFADGGLIAYGIRARAINAATNYAGYFGGLLYATSGSGAVGSMILDHPLDPENKTLQHSNVVSPDMMNIYNGNATLDASGEVIVVLPDYFEALNMEFRYQLTAIEAPGPNLYISHTINNNTFTIAGGNPLSKVSWQVTGIRHDAYAIQNRVEVETDKKAHEVGLYLNPTAHGQSPEKGIHYVDPKLSQEAKATEHN